MLHILLKECYVFTVAFLKLRQLPALVQNLLEKLDRDQEAQREMDSKARKEAEALAQDKRRADLAMPWDKSFDKIAKVRKYYIFC